MNKKYTSEEVEKIIKIALRNKQSDASVEIDSIFDIAKELNIDNTAVQDAINEYDLQGSIDDIRAEYIRKRKKSFFGHLVNYCVVNAFLVLIDIFVSHTISWSILPILAWGLAIFFDGMNKLRYDEADFQRYFKRRIRQNRANNLGVLFDTGVDVATDALRYMSNKRRRNNKYW